ncbi:MAG: hypothetical protein HY342_03620 [Candidatus Lambdaproteobacteria bacterium]|nr:hypothetical protein [Candidatus Lambdaproteobacteria bacterium]
MVARLILLALLAAAIIYVLRRSMPGLFYDPRWRILLSGAGLVLLQQVLRRHGLTLLTRLWSALRLFR